MPRIPNKGGTSAIPPHLQQGETPAAELAGPEGEAADLQPPPESDSDAGPTDSVQ